MLENVITKRELDVLMDSINAVFHEQEKRFQAIEAKLGVQKKQ